MIKDSLTIEDCLEILAGFNNKISVGMISTDYTILSSIARQVSKKVGLTDKQYELCRKKLLETYRLNFAEKGIDIESAVNKFRIPIRVIDRRKYVRINTPEDQNKLTSSAPNDFVKNNLWFCVRFPFSKKLISEIDRSVVDRRSYWHAKGTHEHYFVVNEQNVFNVVDAFKDKDFTIDEQLTEFYEKIIEVKNNSDSYVSTIKDCTLINVCDRAKKIAEEEIGPLEKENLILYIDRKRRYSINFIKDKISPTSLSEQIALRKDADFLSKPSECDLKNLLLAVHNLKRYPLLVITDEKQAEEEVYNTFNFFRHVIEPKQQSVLFRLDSDVGSSFNDYVKQNNLNNWVDKTTKIVYINNIKLPKLLISGDWKPTAALVFGSFPVKYIDSYVTSHCDLIIYRDETLSPFKRILR